MHMKPAFVALTLFAISFSSQANRVTRQLSYLQPYSRTRELYRCSGRR